MGNDEMSDALDAIKRIDRICNCLKIMSKDNHPKIDWILTQIEDMNFNDNTRAALAPVDVEGLANYIRTIDGDNTMGASELAEKITDHLAARGCFGVPEGYALVPIEPTEEMLKAIDGWIGSWTGIWQSDRIGCLRAYKGMLKAAPKKEGK